MYVHIMPIGAPHQHHEKVESPGQYYMNVCLHVDAAVLVNII